MSAISAVSGRDHLESLRRWCYSRIRHGFESAGYVVGVLALLGLAVYGLLVASESISMVQQYPQLSSRVLGLTGWLLWFGSYVWSVARVLRGKRRRRTTQVVAVVALTWSVALYALMGQSFAALPALSFSIMLLCLAAGARGLVAGAVLGVYYGLSVRTFGDFTEIKHVLEQFALSSLIFYAIPRLVIFAGELEDTRSELAQLAVAEQRLRWARDLHDTLGHGLSVVVLKLELVERLNDRDRERAVAELHDAQALLRQSIGEMQTVVAGLRDVSLDAEIANARTILGSAGVTLHTDMAPVVLDSDVAEALAWMVREGTTNVLRHSNSSRCDIGLRVDRGRVVLTLANDGPAVRAASSPSGGHGIRGMRERLNVFDGRLTAKSQKDGGFVLEASVPLQVRVEATR